MDISQYIQWSVRPEIFSAGPFTVRWYGLFFALAFFCGFYIMNWIYRREGKPDEDLDQLFIYMISGTVIGARLGHCLFYEPSYYLSNPIEILKIWHGGLASHGGFIGIIISLYIYSRKKKDQPYQWLLDRMCIPGILGGCFIRIGNLFNSEIIGTPTTKPWAFVFKRVDNIPRHPAQLYESLSYAVIFVILLTFYKKYNDNFKDGFISGLLLVTVFISRFFIEFVKTRQADYGFSLYISVGQWLSIPFIVAGIILIIRACRP